MRQAKCPEFIRFFRPILELLLKSGGTGIPSEIVDRSIEIAQVSEAEQEAVNKNGQSRIKNQVHWTRQYLWSGVGVWIHPKEVFGVLLARAGQPTSTH